MLRPAVGLRSTLVLSLLLITLSSMALAAPSAVSVTPNQGTGLTQTFSFVFADSNGWNYLKQVNTNVSSNGANAGSCLVSYMPANNYIYLLDDAGTEYLPGAPIGSGGTLQNSQCTVDIGGSSASGSANNLTVNVALAFNSSYAGTKSIYMNAVNDANQISTWQVLGQWAVGTSGGGGGGTCSPGPAPSVNICSPTSGSTVPSPVHLVATPSSNNGMIAMAVYFDNTLVYKQNVSSIDTVINAAAGKHYVVVQFWDKSGNVPAKASEYITVSGTGGSQPTATLSANPTSISSGGSSTLTWSTTNATSVSIDNGIGTVAASGSMTVSPTTTTTYTLAASGGGSTASATTTVTVTSGGGGGGTCNPPSSPGAILCTPASGSSVSSPVQFTGAGTGASSSVNHLELWIDGNKVGNYFSDTMSTSVSLASGSHSATLIEVDSSGKYIKSTPDSFTVGSGGGGGTLTSSPQTANVAPNGTVQFSASENGSTASVTWYVDDVQGGSASTGTIDATGLYTAPSTTGTHQVKAVLNSDTSQSATSTVNVVTSTAGLSSIKHIIFVAEENRSFDSYFGKLDEYRASLGLPTDVDGLPDNCSSSNYDWTVPCDAMNKSPDAQGYPTTPIYAFHLETRCIENTSADWIVSHWDFNAEAPSSDTPMMDGFVISAASAAISTGTSDTQGIRAMGFYNAQDLAYPYWLATNFATSDRWFSPEAARTQPNRYYMVGATSGGQAYPSGVPIQQQTIFDELTAKGISWKIYSEDGNSSATAYTQFRANGNIVPFSQFITDAQNGTLPAVAYIEKPNADQHPGIGNNIEDGVNEIRNLVNAVMYGPSWKDSVMIVTFDESGGLYDHVPPPTDVPNPDGIKPLDICTSSSDSRCSLANRSHTAPPYDPDGDFTRTGFRVPMMIVSPFVKPHYVSHTVTDYTSWMKLVETRFGLPALNARDAWASDMTEYFDFTNVPWASPPQNPPAVDYGQCYDSLP